MSVTSGNRLWFLCVVTLTLISQYSGQIHRAKPIKTNGTPSLHNNRFPPAAFSDFDNEATVVRGSSIENDDVTTYFIGHTKETWIYAIVSAMLVGLSGIFPLIIIPIEAGQALKSGVPAARLKLLLSFAVGGLLGDVFLHLLPEAWAHLDQDGHDHEGHLNIGLWILMGIFSFLIVEKIFPEAEDDEDEAEDDNTLMTTTESSVTRTKTTNQLNPVNGSTEQYPRTRSQSKKNKSLQRASNGHLRTKNTKSNNQSNGHVLTNGYIHSNGITKMSAEKKIQEPSTHIKTSGYLNLLANVIDNFTHGLAVAGSYCISTKTGMITTVAVLLHEIPHEVGDFAILLRSGFDRWKAAKAQMLTATGGIVGAIVALTAESAKAAGDRTAWVLPFTSGGFIYIALVTVVPDLLKEQNHRQSALQVVLIVVGIAMVSGVTMLCD